ncbi:hypothetical protein JCM10213_001904 [Rhodosporidiobolus nylandii]
MSSHPAPPRPVVLNSQERQVQLARHHIAMSRFNHYKNVEEPAAMERWASRDPADHAAYPIPHDPQRRNPPKWVWNSDKKKWQWSKDRKDGWDPVNARWFRPPTAEEAKAERRSERHARNVVRKQHGRDSQPDSSGDEHTDSGSDDGDRSPSPPPLRRLKNTGRAGMHFSNRSSGMLPHFDDDNGEPSHADPFARPPSRAGQRPPPTGSSYSDSSDDEDEDESPSPARLGSHAEPQPSLSVQPPSRPGLRRTPPSRRGRGGRPDAGTRSAAESAEPILSSFPAYETAANAQPAAQRAGQGA